MNVEETFEDSEFRMLSTIEHLEIELRSIRTGIANQAILDGVKVTAYGIENPIKGVATISRPEPRMLVLKPFDANNLKAIEQAIIKADIGLTPNNDGKIIRLVFPILTEETRKKEALNIHKMGESAKIAIRNIRRDANKQIDTLQKSSEITEDERNLAKDKVQKMTDDNEKQVQTLVDSKIKEVQTI
jgi:ribosome recycling factor